MSKVRILFVTFAVLAAGMTAALYRPAAETKAMRAEDDKDKPRGTEKAQTDELAAVRKTADEFTKAFDRGDARALAGFWTKTGEYVGPDGETLRGRDAIEKDYADFFKQHPKATMKIHIDSVRLFGPHTALEEGTLKVQLAPAESPGVSRYSVLHVREGDGWKMASVREWIPDAAELVTLKDAEWLIGEWSAKSADNEASASYAWDENKTFIRGRYVVKHKGKVVSSGSQVIGKDPTGGLRSWQFDSNGGTGEWTWTRDENGWVIEAVGVLPDGSEVTAVNLLVPINKDAFTWQLTERTVAGSELPGSAPIKVSRVKGAK